MSSYSLWELNMQELIQDFTGDELTVATAEVFLKGIGFNEIEISSLPTSAERMLLVHANTDYAFTSDDLSWLSLAPKVITALWEGSIKTYVFEMDCDEEDYYICCAAIIKIYNVVFREQSVFVFKLKDAFAVGSLRSYENNTNNNFCVSALIHAIDVSDNAYFLDELTYVDVDDLAPLIIYYSPQEGACLPSKNDDVQYIDPDYLSFLDEVEAFYGESAQKERSRYLHIGKEPAKPIESYKDACNRLLHIAEDDGFSSLEVLEDAEAAKEKALTHEPDLSLMQREESVGIFSEEAYKNVEIMLNELLSRDKN